ncbi:MAG: Glyoxalase/bleomycin resistance protein/dioxygenase [Bacillota bacterium]|nr:Glyoxalase/bleomycin resistance protein/dioxygenase [Bacillota bacterium]
MKIHHIGYLVKNIEAAIDEFIALGYQLTDEVCWDERRDIDLCFMRSGSYLIELVMPKSERSVVWNLLKKNGIGPYHICYETGSLPEALNELKLRGYVVISDPLEAVGISGRTVCFLTGRNAGMIELVEV